MQYQWTNKQQILIALKQSSSRLASSSSSSTFRVTDQDGTIQDLRQMLDQLLPSIEQVKCQSTSIRDEWLNDHHLLVQMERILRDAQGEIDRLDTAALNVDTYETSTTKAQVAAMST